MKALLAFERHLKQLESFFDYPSDHVKCVRRFLPKTNIVVLSPHPDDEVLSGGLALRLQMENHCPVHNVAVTLGSRPSRKLERRRELARALNFLDWSGLTLPENWSEKTKRTARLLKKTAPALVIAPHADDHHPAHIKTAVLTRKAIAQARLTTTVAWAEYWAPQAKPNLLIGISRDTLVRQIRALTFHKGEIERNPYHLLLPAWQMDSVRRGSEWLAGKGAVGAPFVFGQLYRLERWENGRPLRKAPLPVILGPNSDLSDLLVQ